MSMPVTSSVTVWFDLNARIDLDEIERARFHIHQELDRAGILIADLGRHPETQIADLGPLGVGQIGGGRAFDDLLVAPLHGAVALIQVVKPAMAVAQHLHLDMAGAGDHLFEIPLAIAECGFGLAPAFADLGLQLVFRGHGPHAPTAAAPARFQHHRIADLGGHGAHLVHVLGQDRGGRDHRDAGRDRHPPGAGLVAQRAHGLGPGADEGDAGSGAGIDQIGVFRQKAIAGVDRIRAGGPGHPDDLGDRQIGGDRAQPFADAIGLVGLEPVQAQLVFLGEHRHRALAQLVRRPHDADRDLAPVGDQDFLELGHGPPLLHCGAA
jgi:hypothetical protein